MVNSGLCRGDSPSLRNTRAISKTFSMPPTTSRLRYSSGAIAQVQVDVEGVVVGDEGPGRGPARDGVEHRRLHLDEAPVLQPPAGPRHHPAAQEQRLPGPFVGPQVGVALPVAQVDVGDALPLVAEAAPGLGQQDPGGNLHREFTGPGPHHLAGGADPVARATGARTRAKCSVQAAPANSWMAPARVAQGAEGQLAPSPGAASAGPATDTTTPVSPSGGKLGKRGRPARPRWRRARSGTARGSSWPVPHRSLRPKMMRRPSRVSQGSWCSMAAEYGPISPARPPVATTVHGPTSSWSRRHRPSTWAAKP